MTTSSITTARGGRPGRSGPGGPDRRVRGGQRRRRGAGRHSGRGRARPAGGHHADRRPGTDSPSSATRDHGRRVRQRPPWCWSTAARPPTPARSPCWSATARRSSSSACSCGTTTPCTPARWPCGSVATPRCAPCAATLGGDLVRLVETTEYAGPGGAMEQFGLYFVDAGQHLEHRLFVDHNAPHTKSNVDYRGALQGQGAHSVWVGDVLIRKVAEGITTYESNRNLVLTDGCRADSVPNLEIETGEIAGAGPRLDHRPVRRRAAVLPAQPGHHRGRGPPAGGARLLRRHHPPGRRAGDRGAAAGRRRGRAGHHRRTAGSEAGATLGPRACAMTHGSASDDVPPGLLGRRRQGRVRVRRRGRRRPRSPSCTATARFYAIADECSHAAIPLSEGDVGDGEIECYLHGSRFDLRTGEPSACRPPSRSPSIPARFPAMTYWSTSPLL